MIFMVWFLVIQADGTAIIPNPYPSLEACQAAMEAANRRGEESRNDYVSSSYYMCIEAPGG